MIIFGFSNGFYCSLGFYYAPQLVNNELKGKAASFTSFILICGIFIGSFLSKKIDGAKLKPAFGWFVLIMGIYIIIKELFFPAGGGH